jgi:hypothetical protein
MNDKPEKNGVRDCWCTLSMNNSEECMYSFWSTLLYTYIILLYTCVDFIILVTYSDSHCTMITNFVTHLGYTCIEATG